MNLYMCMYKGMERGEETVYTCGERRRGRVRSNILQTKSEVKGEKKEAVQEGCVGCIRVLL